MTVTEEETLPGFWSDIHASGYQLAHLSPVPLELCLLDRYELIEPEIPFSHAFPNGDIISVSRDIEKTVLDIARYSCKDAETWRTLMNRFCLQKDSITKAMFSPPPSFAAAAKEFATSSAGMEAYRFGMQSVRSWANQTLEAEAIKTLFGSFATFLGASPDDAGGAELGWLFASVLQNVGNSLVKGGMNHVTLALAEDLQAHGGEIRTNVLVEKFWAIGKGRRRCASQAVRKSPWVNWSYRMSTQGTSCSTCSARTWWDRKSSGRCSSTSGATRCLSYSSHSTARLTTTPDPALADPRTFI
jgi:phytoene dehydrogenase-like protein